MEMAARSLGLNLDPDVERHADIGRMLRAASNGRPELFPRAAAFVRHDMGRQGLDLRSHDAVWHFLAVMHSLLGKDREADFDV